MSPVERQMGRIMRAPDEHPAPPPPPAEEQPAVEDPPVDLGSAPKGEEQPAAEETDEQREAREADEAKADEQAGLFGAPADDAAYEITGLPEGMAIDAEALEAITPVARELNLSSAGLSKVAAVYAEKVLPGVVERYKADLGTSITSQHATWETQAREAIKSGKFTDDVLGEVELKNAAGEPLGFDGKKLDEVQRIAAKALDKFAPPQLREFLNRDNSGLGLHPLLIQFAYQAGKSIMEDTTFDPSTPASAQPKTRAEKYYGG